jgi:TonB family protein
MGACSSSYLQRTPDLSRRNPARVFWAGVLSLLAHLTVAAALTGGPSGQLTLSNTPTYLTARLVEAVAPLPTELLRSSEDATQPGKKEDSVRPPRHASSAPSDSSKAVHAEKSTAAGDATTDGPDLTYYTSRQLDVYPALSTALDLRYTADASAAGIVGRALLLLLIDKAGFVDDVAVVESEPAGSFEDELRRAFASIRFTPALKDGRAVRSRVLVHVNYGVDDASPRANRR